MIHVDGMFRNKYPRGRLEYGHIVGEPMGNNEFKDYNIWTFPLNAPFQDSRRVPKLEPAVGYIRYLRKLPPWST